MDLPTLRKLVSLDPADPLSHYALGRKLWEQATTNADLEEAATHLTFANEKSPDHLATYHVLAQVLIRLGRKTDARRVLEAGLPRVIAIGGGMGHDLGPAMQDLLAQL